MMSNNYRFPFGSSFAIFLLSALLLSLILSLSVSTRFSIGLIWF
jgi:hypothetical protein